MLHWRTVVLVLPLLPPREERAGERRAVESLRTAALRAAALRNRGALPLQMDAQFSQHALRLGEPRSGIRFMGRRKAGSPLFSRSFGTGAGFIISGWIA